MNFQVTLSEIKAGYWVYNGFQMRGQALSYVQCNFCNSMVDLDVLFVQVCLCFALIQLHLIYISSFIVFCMVMWIDRVDFSSWYNMTSVLKRVGQLLRQKASVHFHR